MALLEERSKKLAAEGLFDEARKQLLPFLPEVIGVVTSPTGAVIRDILHRLSDRFPRHVLVWPVRVQGEGAAEEIAAAIRRLQRAAARAAAIPRPDLLIVARGGGSIEDLWAFNEEIVVRAAADSMIPLISAVGHETDVTLIDYAADRRAPTPTAAAEMAVPVRAELIAELMARRAARSPAGSARRTHRRTELRAHRARCRPRRSCWRSRASGSIRRPTACRGRCAPTRRFTTPSSRASPAGCRRSFCAARSSAGASVTTRSTCGSRPASPPTPRRFKCASPASRSASRRSANAPRRAVRNLIANRTARAERAGQLLTAFSYRGVLSRGFALVRDADESAAARGRRGCLRPATRHRVRRRPRFRHRGRRRCDARGSRFCSRKAAQAGRRLRSGQSVRLTRYPADRRDQSLPSRRLARRTR